MERIYTHWVYTAYYIHPSQEHLVDIANYDGEIVSEDIARSMKFANVNAKGKIGLRYGTLAHQEVYGCSTEEEVQMIGEKQYYYLTDQDKQNVLEIYKVEMRSYLKKHYDKVLDRETAEKYKDKRKMIEKQIQNCFTLKDAYELFYNRFGLDTLQPPRDQYDIGDSCTTDLSISGKDNFN